MKKILLILFVLALGFTPATAKKSPAEKAAGNYSGQLFIGMGSPVTDETESSTASIKLEKETDTTVKFTLPDFKYGSMSLGDIVLTGIPVTEDTDGKVRFGKNDPQTLSVMGGVVNANVNIDETTSYIDGDYAYIDVFVTTKILFSNVNIYVRFKGNNAEYVADGIAQQMEGTRNGTLYNGLTSLLTSEDDHAASSVEVAAVDASHISLTLKDVEVQGLWIGDMVFQNIGVTAGTEENILLTDGMATGSVMGTMDYSATLLGAQSYWSADTVGLTISFDIEGQGFYLVFTTGTLPPPVEEVVTGPAAEVAGKYNAAIYVELGTPVTSETLKFTDADVVIVAETETTVSFSIKDFSLDGENSLGDIVLSGIPVEQQKDGSYTFGANNPQTITLAGGALSADVKIDENTSYIRDGELYIDVPVQAMGETIYVHVGLPVRATGIGHVTTNFASKAIYDLSGRRLTQWPTIPGVYIIGGRKVYVK